MKIQVLLTMLLFCSFTSFAQFDGPSTAQRDHNLLSGLDAPNSGFGIKGGVNFANLHGSDKDVLGDISGHTDFHAGVFAQISFGEFFSIQPEALFSRKGFERNDSTYRLNYFDVPVLAVFNISENFSVHLGPQVGVMVAASQEDKEVTLEPYNTFGYGAVAGLEGRISRFRLGARYVHSLEELQNQNAAGEPINLDFKNSVVQVYFGIGF